jgi:zinc transporter ZupT
MNDLLKIFLLMSVVFLGAGIAYYLKSKKVKSIDWVLSFSGAFIFGIIFIDLLPHIYKSEIQHQSRFNASVWILLGFILQIILDQFSKGVEHGHMHGFHGPKVKRTAITVILGLGVHSFIEGLPLAHNISSHIGNVHNDLLISILLHKGTAAFAVAFILFQSELKLSFSLLLLAIFSIMSPLGLWTSSFFAFNDTLMHAALAFVTGSLLHISTTILFEIDNSKNHSLSILKIISIIFGLGAAYLSFIY